MKIITVMSDEHSYHMMRFINHSILKTPNLDRLASQSTVFDACYTPCPVCAPARASFMAGQYINRLGTWDNSTPYDGSVPGLSHYLTSHGISYACIGKTHFHPDGSYQFSHTEFPGYMNRPDIGCFFRDQKTGRVGAEKRFEKIGLKTEENYDDKVLASSLSWLEDHSQEESWHLFNTKSSDEFKKDAYSCAMKSHFRKFGNQMSGSGNKPRNPAKLVVSSHFKEIDIYYLSKFYLPRHSLKISLKSQ